MPRHDTEDVAEYQAITAAPRQARFPPRRKVVRPKSALPRLTKSQSTLTQVGWAGLPSSGSRTMESDDDFARLQPKRRRKSRKLGKTESQPTYTQAVHSAPARRARRARLDEDGYEIWQDHDEALDTPMRPLRRDGRARAAAQSKLPDHPEVEPGDDESNGAIGLSLEIPESELYEPRKATHGSSVQSDLIASKPFATPQRAHFREIPSSQSPASAKLSPQRSVRDKRSPRSPLKEKSANARSPIKLSLKVPSPMLGKDRSLATPDDDHATLAKAVTITPRAVHILNRTNTIPETQYDDLELSLDVEEAEAKTQLLLVPQQGARRTFSRTNTIQDSQHEDSDLDLDWPDPTQHIGEDADNENMESIEAGTYSEVQPEENTYDPVYSALDRDYARFADQIQTQIVKLEPHVSNSTHSEDEEVLEEKGGEPESSASDQLSNELIQAAEAIPSSQPSERLTVHTTDHFAVPAIPDQVAMQNVASEHHEQDHHDDERVPSSPPPHQPTQLLQDAELRIPSSPPPLRPSQVSTVVPTQMSPRRPLSQEGGESISRSIKREKETQNQALLLVSSPQIQMSPQKALHSWPETYASSSPLPLPPWSSPDRAKLAAAGTQNVRRSLGMESFADFSLPPPPPLSSSSGREE